jgi:hypothetical protein
MAWRTLARSVLLGLGQQYDGSRRTKLTTFCSRLGHGDFDRPALPADLLLAAHDIPGLASSLLKKLHRDLAAAASAVAAAATTTAGAGATANAGRLLFFQLSYQHLRPLVDQRLEFIVVDVRQR